MDAGQRGEGPRRFWGLRWKSTCGGGWGGGRTSHSISSSVRLCALTIRWGGKKNNTNTITTLHEVWIRPDTQISNRPIRQQRQETGRQRELNNPVERCGRGMPLSCCDITGLWCLRGVEISLQRGAVCSWSETWRLYQFHTTDLLFLPFLATKFSLPLANANMLTEGCRCSSFSRAEDDYGSLEAPTQKHARGKSISQFSFFF